MLYDFKSDDDNVHADLLLEYFLDFLSILRLLWKRKGLRIVHLSHGAKIKS